MASRSLTGALLLLAAARPALSAANAVENPQQGSQYIKFSGEVTGTVSWATDTAPAGRTGCAPDGQPHNMGHYTRSHLYVGVNPPWDPNPFFFELYHFASDCEASFCFTRDSIYNLDFASAAYQCYNPVDKKPCGLITFNPLYQKETYLDLKTKA